MGHNGILQDIPLKRYFIVHIAARAWVRKIAVGILLALCSATTGARRTVQHDHLGVEAAENDLGRPAVVAFLVLPLAGADRAARS